MIDLEPCWSGLSSIFAKDVGAKPPRGFESLRLRYENTLSAQLD